MGKAEVADTDELILMEANDNHMEEHTVKEFISWCISGRDKDESGKWESKGTGKYLEGGKAAGGQLTDQRFACRILEGELRFNMVNTVCLGVIHKVPAPGGMSAVGGTGSEYFYYDNGIISDQKLGTAEFTAYVQKEKSADGNLHRCPTDDGPKKVEEGTHEKKTISIDLAALAKKFIDEDCPVLMKTLELPDECPRRRAEVGRRRVQLLVRRHLQVPRSLLQAGHTKCVLEGHPSGGSGACDQVWRHCR